jgi:hypothetical protein
MSDGDMQREPEMEEEITRYLRENTVIKNCSAHWCLVSVKIKIVGWRYGSSGSLSGKSLDLEFKPLWGIPRSINHTTWVKWTQ